MGYDIACDVLFIMWKMVRGDNYCMIRRRKPLVPLGQVSAKVSLKKKGWGVFKISYVNNRYIICCRRSHLGRLLHII